MIFHHYSSLIYIKMNCSLKNHCVCKEKSLVKNESRGPLKHQKFMEVLKLFILKIINLICTIL